MTCNYKFNIISDRYSVSEGNEKVEQKLQQLMNQVQVDNWNSSSGRSILRIVTKRGNFISFWVFIELKTFVNQQKFDKC